MIESPLLDLRSLHHRLPGKSAPFEEISPPMDRLLRPLHDLRLSVIDQCNFRCSYCMPKEIFGPDHQFLPHAALLTFDEMERLARAFISLGVRKIRISGGEPLLRKGIEQLITRLANLKTTEGNPIDIAVTTNGSLLSQKARVLAAAGLKRLNVSLDALDPMVFQQLTHSNTRVSHVLAGISEASAAGIRNIKINMVVRRGINERQILHMARHFRYSGYTLRFIEFMDVGETNGWNRAAVVPSREVLDEIHKVFPITRVAPAVEGEVAQRWRYQDGAGEIGVISSVTQPFCGDCSRARISADGKLYTCLFAEHGIDLRSVLRQGADATALARTVASQWRGRIDRYSANRQTKPRRRKIEMSYIGG